jgi:hypothetical protein
MTKRSFQLAVFIVAFGFGSAVVYFRAPGLLSTAMYPTDSELEKRFADRRTKFDSLLRLFQEDSHLRSVNNGGAWVDFDTPAQMSAERLQTYFELFSELGVRSVHRWNPDASIEFRVWSSPRFFIGGRSKSYIYDPKYSGKITNSLDEIYRSGVDANDFKPLGDHWHLYLDVW